MLDRFIQSVKKRERARIDMWHELCIEGSEETVVRHPRADDQKPPPAKGSMDQSINEPSNSDDDA